MNSAVIAATPSSDDANHPGSCLRHLAHTCGRRVFAHRTESGSGWSTDLPNPLGDKNSQPRSTAPTASAAEATAASRAALASSSVSVRSVARKRRA